MVSKSTNAALLAVIALSACKPGDYDTSQGSNVPAEFTISHVPSAALTAAYVTNWAPFEAAAAALRNSAKYQSQKFSWSWTGSPVYNSFSLAHGRVEYAHAAGLTGAGQTISIIDAGFLTSHTEFNGKSISTPSGFTPGVDDHGTTVAAVAAGSATSGQSVGVAPGANLALGSFNSNQAMKAATNQAIALGAIVQNNSWGVTDASGNEYAATNSNFQSLYGSGDGATYYATLKNFAQNAVVVFAASNDSNRTTSDLMGGMPLIDPTVQNHWITVVNAIPTFNGETIQSATVISSKCLQSAAWCMAADGTVDGAIATGTSNYKLSTGTSFAAPQVSGAIALLAEAFPTLNAEELRARLLASADNNFYQHTGYVEFAQGVQHGFNPTYGHGFLNMQAALSPIGGAYVPRSNGQAVPLGNPVLLGAGMSGNALSTRLAQYDLTMVDGMGAGFQVPASVLSADAVNRYDPMGAIQTALSVDLGLEQGNPFHSQSEFASFSGGQELEFEAEDTRLAMLLPDGNINDGSYGVAVSRGFDLGGGQLRLGLSAMVENNGFVGMKSLGKDDSISGTHGAMNFEWAMPMDARQELRMSGSLGVASARDHLSDMSLSQVQYNAFKLSYGARNIWGNGDRFSMSLGLPHAVQSGSANVVIPVARGDGSIGFDGLDVALAPLAREVDFSLDYGVSLSGGSQLVLGAVRRFNQGNIAGENATEASFAIKLEF